MFNSPQFGVDGSTEIPQFAGKIVWETLYNMVENRMKNGDFTVVDATFISYSMIKEILSISKKYSYEVYCLDFTNVGVNTALKNNEKRKNTVSYVNPSVINSMNNKINSKFNNVRNIFKDIKFFEYNENSEKELISAMSIKEHDFNNYEKVICFGDIHGCYSVLQKYFLDHPFSEKNMYIFAGDYIDRGIENGKTMNFLYTLKDKSNVKFIRGNHERNFGNIEKHGTEFINNTYDDLIKEGFNEFKQQEFWKCLEDVLCFTFNKNKYVVSHAPISKYPSFLMSTKQFTKGVAKYEECLEVESTWSKNEEAYLIHGHCNIDQSPIIGVSGKTFNLEGQVEFGGNLRILEFTKKEEIIAMEYKNNIFKTESNIDLLSELRGNKYIKERVSGEISSFNFTQEAFKKRIWDDQTIKARGLFINNETGKIIARSYNKFFRLDEMEFTTLESLKGNLCFPIDAYQKENGFLGLVTVHNDELLLTTKSLLDGEYVDIFKRIFFKKIPVDVQNRIKEKFKGKTLIFEVIDPINDPHIVEYLNEDIILLDIIDNETGILMPYDYLTTVLPSELEYVLNIKKKVKRIQNQDELEKFCDKVQNDNDYSDKSEGYVLVDSAGFMFKVKTKYYTEWKFLRGVVHSIVKHGDYNKKEKLDNELKINFYNFIKNNPELITMEKGSDVISIRKIFEENNNGKE